MCQENFVKKLEKRFGLEEANPNTIPGDQHFKLFIDIDLI